MRTIIIPTVEVDPDGKQIMSPLSLSQSLDSLLGSKSSLTTEWADSVRSIMNNSSACGSPMTCTSSSDHSLQENVHDRQHCLDLELAKLEGENSRFLHFHLILPFSFKKMLHCYRLPQTLIETGVLDIAGEMNVLRTALGVSNSHRRSSLNRMLDLKGTVLLFCTYNQEFTHFFFSFEHNILELPLAWFPNSTGEICCIPHC